MKTEQFWTDLQEEAKIGEVRRNQRVQGVPGNLLAKRLSARSCALAKVVNETHNQGFLAIYPGDLVHDGYALWELREDRILAWVIYDCGTHMIYSRQKAETVKQLWGDNKTGDRPLQWYRLEEEEIPDPETTRWTPCTADEAIALFPVEEEE